MGRISDLQAVTLTSAFAVCVGACPPARADPIPMAAQNYSKVSDDGWHLNITLTGETVNSVPNLAAAANSREGFVTVKGIATATGGSTPITDSLFILGYQLGC